MAESDLFFESHGDAPESRPLADRMRPRTFDEYVGQEHVIGRESVLRKAIENGEIQSVIFWGPPGTGKTTLAHIIAGVTGSSFIAFSAVTSGVKDIRGVVSTAEMNLSLKGHKTILFVDEIHRFNKAQQDAFLPHVEKGTIILIGATTENPSFEVISALLSRSKVFTLEQLIPEDLKILVTRTLEDKERGLGDQSVDISDEVVDQIARYSNGDARSCLNTLEFSVMTTRPGKDGVRHITKQIVMDAMQKSPLVYDKGGEEHYNIISAFHKSLRGSDPDAAIYWMTRMFEGGEDPMYVARRMIRFASEDIGNADPQALVVTNAAKEAYHMLGTPEGELALVQAAVYLATAPKSNSLYTAFADARQTVRDTQNLPVPLHIRNAPTKLMKELDYGKGYAYDHDHTDGFSGQDHLPEELAGKKFYHPKEFGFEREIKKRMEWWEKKKAEIRSQDSESGKP